MPAYCYKKYAPKIEKILFSMMLEGNRNWLAVPTIKLKGLQLGVFGHLDREDSIRRVADDMVRNGRLMKMKTRYAMYKHIYAV